MKKSLLICWRYFPEYRKEIVVKLSKYFDITYMYGQNANEDTVLQVDKLDGIKLAKHRVYSIFKGFFYFDVAFYSTVKEKRPDYIVLQPTPRDLSIYFKLFWCKYNRVKVIGWGMGKMPGRNIFVQRIHDFLVAMVVKRLDSMICYSSAAENYYNKLAPSLKTNVIVNTKTITDDSLGFSIKKKISTHPKLLKIVFVGRLISSKQIDVLIKAVSEVKESVGLSIDLHIIGEGPEREALQKLACALSIQSRFYGFKRDSELYSILRDMDIFVLPSLGGLAIIDALYSSLPVISGPADGTEKDLVIEGYNGYTLDSVSSKLIAEKIVLAYQDGLLRLGLNSKKLYVEKFQIDKFIDRFVESVKV